MRQETGQVHNECNGMLAFRFFKSRYVFSALYDLKKGKQIYCAPKVQCTSDGGVPFFNAIVGAYKSQFVCVLSNQYLDYEKEHNPDIVEKYLPDGYDPENDNPVIAFYDVLR